MSLDPLLPYFEQELQALQELAPAFARRHPHAAPQLGSGDAPEPHLERMLEALAFLAARLRKSLDDDHREVAEALLQSIHPQATRPTPSATHLALTPRSPLAGPLTIPRGQTVLGPDTGSQRIRFRTCREVELWPLQPNRWELEDAEGQPRLTLDLQVTGPQDLSRLSLSRLTFHLEAEGPGLDRLSEALLHRLRAIHASTVEGVGSGPIVPLPPEALQAEGFDDTEALLDPDPWDPPMLRLLLEWFTLPSQFQVISLQGLDHPDLRRPSRTLRLAFLLEPGPWIEPLRATWRNPAPPPLRLGCTPAVNLLSVQADPILLTHRQDSYPLRVGPGLRVHGVTSVTWAAVGGEGPHPVSPMVGHPAQDPGGSRPLRWHLTRHGTGAPRLVLVEEEGPRLRPERELLRVQTLCSQGDLPRIQAPGRLPPWHLPGLSVPVEGTPLATPTPWRPPVCDLGSAWRLVSHLSLALAPLTRQGLEGLQDLVRLHDPGRSPSSNLQVEAMESLAWRPTLARVAAGPLPSFLRGLEAHLALDEARFGPGWLLFAGLLDRVLAAGLGVNRFHRLHVHPRHRPGEEFRWPPRTGLGLLT